MDLVNGPSNKVDTRHLVRWIKAKGKSYGIKVNALGKANILKKGLHALLAVNQGSDSDPAFVIAEYQGNTRKDAKTVGLVAKESRLTLVVCQSNLPPICII